MSGPADALGGLVTGRPRVQSCATPVRRPYAFLGEDEALFVACAFSRLLPEPESDEWRVAIGAAAFVDERVQAGNHCTLQVAIDLGIGELRLTGAQVARVYRGGIAAVQHHCLARYGEPFHDLSAHRQHLVLGLLERGAVSAGLAGHAVLFPLLVQHAAEAYFEATHVALMRAARAGTVSSPCTQNR